jgi:hypothetical protein
MGWQADEEGESKVTYFWHQQVDGG